MTDKYNKNPTSPSCSLDQLTTPKCCGCCTSVECRHIDDALVIAYSTASHMAHTRNTLVILLRVVLLLPFEQFLPSAEALCKGTDWTPTPDKNMVYIHCQVWSAQHTLPDGYQSTLQNLAWMQASLLGRMQISGSQSQCSQMRHLLGNFSSPQTSYVIQCLLQTLGRHLHTL